MEKSTHGGNRRNSGRKNLDPKMLKICLRIYIEQYKIDNLGGIENTKSFIINAVNSSVKITQ